MEKEASAGGGIACAVLDKLFRGILVLLYGAHPSEPKAQKLARWGTAMLIIVGSVIALVVFKTMHKPARTSFRARPPSERMLKPPSGVYRPPAMGRPGEEPTRYYDDEGQE